MYIGANCPPLATMERHGDTFYHVATSTFAPYEALYDYCTGLGPNIRLARVNTITKYNSVRSVVGN